jgi:uncharacterized protein (DUF1697 family)
VTRSWVVLLRAVNLGARNKVPMAELRKLLEEDGFGDVRSYIASGNLLFAGDGRDRAALAERLEALILDAFDVRTTAILRTDAELRKVLRSHPFGDDVSHTYVTFLAGKPPADRVRALAGLEIGDNELAAVGREVYARYPSGYGNARISAAALEKKLGVAGTARNWRTVTALVELTRS